MERVLVRGLIVTAGSVLAVLTSAASAQPRAAAPENSYTSAQMYHRLFENGRLRTAAAMAARGDCKGALAYAERKHSPDTAAAVRRICSVSASGTSPTPAPVAAAVLRPVNSDQEVAAFAADPRRPLFKLVLPDMVSLLKRGRATGLQDAYDIAVAERAARARSGQPLDGPDVRR